MLRCYDVTMLLLHFFWALPKKTCKYLLSPINANFATQEDRHPVHLYHTLRQEQQGSKANLAWGNMADNQIKIAKLSCFETNESGKELNRIAFV